MTPPNHALQRTGASRRGCNRRPSWPPSLSLGRCARRWWISSARVGRRNGSRTYFVAHARLSWNGCAARAMPRRNRTTGNS